MRHSVVYAIDIVPQPRGAFIFSPGDSVQGVDIMSRPTDGTEPGTPAELIASAVQTEREAAWFYKMMAEMTSDEEAKDMLLKLSKDEESHATTLTDLYYELTSRRITQPTTTHAEGDPNLFDTSTTSRRNALEFALQNEKNAVDLYQAQAGAANSPRVATIFRLLADTERDHAAYIQLQLSRLDTQKHH